jgi:hypothetical protein
VPIRKRLSGDAELEPVSDNVITTNNRAKDKRGVFDPKKDPLKGSAWENMGETPFERGAVIGFLGYMAAEEEEVPRPEDVTTQNLLTQVRTSRNRCNIEHKYRNRIVSPLSGVRAMCVVTCKSGSVKAVTLCGNVSCPLWAFRMGTNGLRGKQ